MHMGLTNCINLGLMPPNNCSKTGKLKEESKGWQNIYFVIRRSRFKLMRYLFHFKVQNIKNNWDYIMNMWHSTQMTSTKWGFMAEYHRSLINHVMDQKVLKS